MNPRKFIRQYKITFYLFLLVVFSLSISRNIFIISLWPWLLSWILEGNFREKFQKGFKSKELIPLLSVILFFLFYAVSLFWSSNKPYGTRNLSEMATLIIVPFFIVFSSDDFKKKGNMVLILKVFLAGLIISSLFLLIVALTKSLSFHNGDISFTPAINDWENVFFNTNFTYMIHPSYYSLMFLMGIAICFNDFQFRILFKDKLYIPGLISLYFIIIVFLTQCRAAFFALLALAFYHLILYKTKPLIKIISFTIILTASLLYLENAFRFKDIREKLSEDSVSETNLLSTNIRYKIWSSAFTIINDNPLLGVGIGDEQDKLDEMYMEKQYFNAFNQHLNCHNQFLQTWLSTGFIGLIILLFTLFYPLFSHEQWLKPYYVSFVVLVIIMFFFESMFERVWGVSFFGIFYILLTRRYEHEKTQEPIESRIEPTSN